MFKYILKRIIIIIPTLLATSLLIFWAMDIAGGDPVDQILPENASIEQREELRKEMGFDDPFAIRYLRYVCGILKGDMGTSYISGQDVFKTFMGRLYMTLILGCTSLLFACVISIPLGIYTALNENTFKDTLATIVALFGVSMPNFWLGLMLILLFSLKLGWLPSGGTGGFKYIILPSVTVGLSLAALLTRTTRSAMLDVIRQDYITTARAKGASHFRVVFNHGLRNAMIPIVTAIGMQLSFVMTGSVLAETVFGWPGIGRLVVDSINKRDTPMVTGSIILCCVLMTIINLVVDIVYAFCDPRIMAQYSKKG